MNPQTKGGPGSGPQGGSGESHADKIEGTQAEAAREVTKANASIASIKGKIEQLKASHPSARLEKLTTAHHAAAAKTAALAGKVAASNSKISALREQLAALKRDKKSDIEAAIKVEHAILIGHVAEIKTVLSALEKIDSELNEIGTPKMKSITVSTELCRQATLARDDAGAAIGVSISSDVPYLRHDYRTGEPYFEQLDHAPGGCDEERLKAGLPILFNHDRDQHLARATSYVCDGTKYTLPLKDFVWASGQFAAEKKADMESGALPDTSVGYEIADSGEQIGERDGVPVIRFKWKIYEASAVTIPADASVGTGRHRSAEAVELKEILISEKKDVDEILKFDTTTSMPEPTAEEIAAAELAKAEQEAADKLAAEQAEAAAAALISENAEAAKVEAEKAITIERERIAAIAGFVANFKVSNMKAEVAELSAKAIADGTNFVNFRLAVLDNWHEAKPVATGASQERETMKRSDFEKLPAFQQGDFCRRGGKISD